MGRSPDAILTTPPMMDGSYFDRITVGEIKQQSDAQIADAGRDLEQKLHSRDGKAYLRLAPQK